MISTGSLAQLVLSFSGMSNKKLQKICYYIYAWYLTIYGQKIADVEFQAWVHGPVSRKIYNQFKEYGWNDIPRYIGFLMVDNEKIRFAYKVYQFYNRFTADELEAMTHQELPWQNARKDCLPFQSSNKVIQDGDIIQYYSNQNEIMERILN